MGLRGSSPVVCVLAVLAGCAKGGLPGNDAATTFGTPTATATNAMTSSDPTDATTDGATETDGETGSAAASNSGTAESDPSASEVGGDDCGNGVIDGAEQCDGDELDGADCMASGFAGGMIACTAQCTLDTSGCAMAVCGDGVLQDGESCDCGMGGSPCTAAQLGNQSCTGLGNSGGELLCTPACSFDEGGCTSCGDGVIDAGEACDGANLAGQSCQSQGFDAGALSCSGSCTFNTGGCVDYFCGNGTCDPGEDSCNCADCPDDPNTCGSPCKCGGLGGNCYCDLACLDFGDCCPNGPC